MNIQLNPNIKSLAVYCASKAGKNPKYQELAYQIGKFLAQNKIRVVYGGGSQGIMGSLANGVLDNKGELIGVIPEILNNIEHKQENLSQVIYTKDMHSRKANFYNLADAFMVLPGSLGTMDEFFEVFVMNYIGQFSKEIYLINFDNYYDSLIALLKKMIEEEFMISTTLEAVKIINISN